MKTDDITIGRNPGLTYQVLAAVARRAEQESARKRRRQRLAEALTRPLRWARWARWARWSAPLLVAVALHPATLHAQPLTGSASEQLEWQRREIQRMQDDLQRQRLAQQRAAMEAQRQADEAQRQADEAARRAARQRAPQVSVPVRPPAVQLDTEGRAWLAAFIRRVQADPRLDAESKRRIIDDTLRRAGY